MVLYNSLRILAICTLMSGCSASIGQLNDPRLRQDTLGKLNTKSTKVLVISDLNSSYGSTTYSPEVHEVISKIPQLDPQMVLIPGDMVAGQKLSLTDENVKAMWKGFREAVLDPIYRQKIPLGFTVGNHDASPGFKTDRQQADEFWKHNKEKTNLEFVDDTHFPFYYSYVLNNIFFISWDAAASAISPEIYSWMKIQLRGKTARKSKLQILTGHLPLYAIVDSKNKPGEVNADPAFALDFFKKQGIDIYISGHQHAYFPAKKDGISFLNSGCVGDGPRQLIGDDNPPQKTYTIIEIPYRKASGFTYRTYSATNQELIDHKNLPAEVSGFNGISKLEIR